MIDDVEVGRRVSPRLRIASRSLDARGVTSDLVLGGAELIAEPTVTPLQSLDSRLSAPADLQITVFEELDGRGPERTPARPLRTASVQRQRRQLSRSG